MQLEHRPAPVCSPRELDDALGLTTMAAVMLAGARTGRNGCHGLAGVFWQSVFGRFAGYEDMNGAERLRHDAAMRWRVVFIRWSENFLSLTS